MGPVTSFLSPACLRAWLRALAFPEADRHLLELSQPQEEMSAPHSWTPRAQAAAQDNGAGFPAGNWLAVGGGETREGRGRQDGAPGHLVVDSLHVSGASHFP